MPVEHIFSVVDWLRRDAEVPLTIQRRDGSQAPSTLKRIIDAAERTLEDKGPAGFRKKGKGAVIGHIAREAGVTPYTLYYYFKDGASLLRTAQTGEYSWEENRRLGYRSFEPEDHRAPDILLFLAGTGWHATELNRFIEGGEIRPRMRLRQRLIEPVYQHILNEGDGVVWCPCAKKGGELSTRVSKAMLDVAKKLKGSGRFARKYVGKEIERACKDLGIPPFKPSWMRHTVATYATNHGAPSEAVQAFLNHADSTTSRFYDDGVAFKVPTPL